MKRDCIDCKYIFLDMGEPGYSEYTPGASASIFCQMKKWGMGNYDGLDDFRKNIAQAETCEHFEKG